MASVGHDAAEQSAEQVECGLEVGHDVADLEQGGRRHGPRPVGALATLGRVVVRRVAPPGDTLLGELHDDAAGQLRVEEALHPLGVGEVDADRVDAEGPGPVDGHLRGRAP